MSKQRKRKSMKTDHHQPQPCDVWLTTRGREKIDPSVKKKPRLHFASDIVFTKMPAFQQPTRQSKVSTFFKSCVPITGKCTKQDAEAYSNCSFETTEGSVSEGDGQDVENDEEREQEAILNHLNNKFSDKHDESKNAVSNIHGKYTYKKNQELYKDFDEDVARYSSSEDPSSKNLPCSEDPILTELDFTEDEEGYMRIRQDFAMTRKENGVYSDCVHGTKDSCKVYDEHPDSDIDISSMPTFTEDTQGYLRIVKK
ncbi:uncharacterized protein LOC102804123 [Saccoglossus kowalevskii]|uniref:Uncharacterized protein LOC102804123 n=1 Tax=Saccoglossus kowalevskii TaxID=10224 RepID=A0ABM0N1B4_SACKO|nr:PREDICTED: uncharacterized protein LOC102804123 [Saccoglossus kowalevskii]